MKINKVADKDEQYSGCIGVTGASGTLGKLLIKRLKNLKLKFNCFNGNICSQEEISTWIDSSKYHAIIHLAAIVPIIKVSENIDDAFEVNTQGTKKLSEQIIKSEQNPWMFYASTSHVYKSKLSPILESDPIEPTSEYGDTKYQAERVLQNTYSNLCIGRIFSFYHNTQKSMFLYPRIMERLDSEDLSLPFELIGAESKRDFLNAEYVVELIIQLMSIRAVGVYNIGSGQAMMIKDFVQSLTSQKLDIKQRGDSNYLVANIAKLNKVLGKT